MQNKNTKGWKGIGRSLVVAAVGPDGLADQLHDPNVVVVQLEGTPVSLARRRALSPDLVDVVVLECTGDDRDDMLELGRVLRGRYLNTVLVLPRDSWGKRVFRSYLGVFRHSGRVVLPELWMAVSVAAQSTWTLGWLRLDKKRDIREATATASTSKVIDMTCAVKTPKEPISQVPQDVLQGANDDVGGPRKSRTTPWAPPPALLVELTKAFTEDE